MTIDRQVASALAESGLSAVVGPEIVSRLREDSPLALVGLSTADLVCVSDAVARAADARGLDCVLVDSDLAGLDTVADLVTVITLRAGTS